VAGAACELVLGDLPPLQGASTGTTGTGSSRSSATGSSSSSGATGSTSSSSGDGGLCCDCDGDHFAAEGECGGQDCDDTDARVYPGEPTYYAVPSKNVGFDWDCSGTPEPNPALNKTVDCGLVALPCATTTGYLAQTPPACGVAAPWGTCTQQGINCVEDVIVQAQVMTCK
jgi:hypothetical protein